MKYVLILLLCFNVLADCPQKVTPIEKGEASQCTGYVFSPDAEKDAAKDRDDVQFYKELADKLTKRSILSDKENNILSQRLNLYINESNVLAKDKAQHDTTDNLLKFAYFAAGVLVTGIIASNIHR